MNKVGILIGLATTLVIIGACGKPAPPVPAGPTLNPPAQSSGDNPADTAPMPDEKKGVEIGAPGPAWANLEGTDGRMHSLKDIADAEVVAVVFTCNECPVAKAYEDRLNKFASDYKDKGVELVAINVNKRDREELPAMKERATERDFQFAYLSDPSQAIGRQYGAAVTPHAFVLDKNRNVVYLGAIDDNIDEAAATTPYLRNAVDAALAGKAPEVSTSKPFGCGIGYE